jgi:hypothetical protein
MRAYNPLFFHFLVAYRHAKHVIYFKNVGVFSHQKKAFQKNELGCSQCFHAVFKSPLAAMPKSILWKSVLQFFHFGMPATIHAEQFLSIKSWDDLKTAWLGLAHSFILMKKASEMTSFGDLKNNMFNMPVYTRKMPKQWVLCSQIGQK